MNNLKLGVLLFLGACGGTYNVQGDAYVHHVIEVDTTFIERLCADQPTQQLKANCEANLYDELMQAMQEQGQPGGGH